MRLVLVTGLCGALGAAWGDAPVAASRPADERSLWRRFSATLDAGATFAPPQLGSGAAPLYLGATVSYWWAEWFLLDAHSDYAFNTRRSHVVAGARARTLTWPFAGSLGLRVGAIDDPVAGLRFAVSPVGAVDLVVDRHFILALEGCVDIPIAGNGTTVRVGLSVGWRL